MFSNREFSKTPYSGLPPAEVIAALLVLQASEEFRELAIISILPRDNGTMLVRTGRMLGLLNGGGRTALLRRTESGWIVEETGLWAS